MDVLIALLALALLILAAYRGFSVILFAPLAAMLAVLLTDPNAVPTVFSGLFMERLVSFLKLYLPIFLLGALFGKLMSAAGFSSAIVRAITRVMGAKHAIPAIVLVCALLTYGGVSLYVVVFVAYPFAVELFRQADIPKRLIPATIVLGAFTFTMDALPGTPQIQNIIPTAFFGTTAWAAPILGLVGAFFVLGVGLTYLDWARRRAAARGEGYGSGHREEPENTPAEGVSLALALLPLLIVPLANFALTRAIPIFYPDPSIATLAGLAKPVEVDVKAMVALWSIEGALIAGIVVVLGLAFSRIAKTFAEQTRVAVSGALLAGVNTASEYGFGAVIAALPGFVVVRQSLAGQISEPLSQVALTVTTLAGMTGSASGGLSIALGAMGDHFQRIALDAGISLDVLHRVASMASGGMDTLPHNGGIITLLTVTGLTHREAYVPIFGLTLIKVVAVGVVIAFYYVTGIS